MAKRKVFTDVWALVQQGDPNECWEWQGCKNNTGYGSITISQKVYSAHRIVYALTYPYTIDFRAPKNKSLKQFILHKCDNRLCCNPNHMELGNYNDNNKDAANKGRSNAPKGANHAKAKLTQEQAEQVRLIHKTGLTYVAIGKMFNIHANNISRIVKMRGYTESRV
jgi:hypothetical protein